ncbi:caspase, EACC1-associated type [Nonomuraea sp. NPDC002799]
MADDHPAEALDPRARQLKADKRAQALHELRRKLRAVDPDLTTRDIAEALWLACHVTPERAPEAPEASRDEPGRLPRHPVARHDSPPQAKPAVPEQGSAALHAAGDGGKSGAQAGDLVVPLAPMLGNVLAIQRALRPLKRRRPSPVRRVLDERITAERIADTGLWVPAMSGVPERWLDLVLVVDTGPSMRMWRPLAGELRDGLVRLGAFRDVRVHYLSGEGVSQRPGGPAAQARTLLDPARQRIILVLSDCSGKHWWNGHAPAMLREWALSGPTAVLQPLPERMWRRTAMAAVPGTARPFQPFAANSGLGFLPRDGAIRSDAVPVPILELNPSWLGDWAKLLAGSAATGLTVSCAQISVRRHFAAERVERESALPVADRVRRFRVAASPEAARLAAYLATASPSLAVMRLVQRTMLPRSNPAVLAEVLLSGLLQPVSDDRFVFVDHAREALLTSLPRTESWNTIRVLRQVSAEIERRAGLSSETFTAWRSSGAGGGRIESDDAPFAVISPEAVRLLDNLAIPLRSDPSPVTRHGAGAAKKSGERLLLAKPGAHVLLVGSGTFPPSSQLPSVPAVETTIGDLGSCLVDHTGLDPSRLTLLMDPASPGELAATLDSVASQANDALLIYYVGHGLVDAYGELNLATQATSDLSQGSSRYQALPYEELHRIVGSSRAELVIMVLDCTFAGRALSHARRGMYLLASASRDSLAWAPAGERHTAFSGALIRLLAQGDPGGPPLLTLDYVYRSLTRSLVERGLPRPLRLATDLADLAPLAPNPALRAPAARLPALVDGEVTWNPYRGLAPFGVEDAPYFFGREQLTAFLVQRVLDQFSAGAPLLVVGPSGCGKSSLLRAGLIPALTSALPSSPILFRPGAHPVAELARQLGLDSQHDLHRSPELLRAHALPPRQVIIIDQFEEVFLSPDTQELQAFLRLVQDLCAESRDTAVVIALRADFLGHCASYPELVPALKHIEVVTSMSSAELREAIAGPARVAGLELQDGLVDVLLSDLGIDLTTAGPSVLPFLSWALSAIWQRREGRVLTLRAYQASGGLGGGLAQAAEDTLNTLDPAGQQLAKSMLLRLVYLDEGHEDTRRRVDLAELLPNPKSQEYELARQVIGHFVDARLVVVDHNGAEIAHEALIRSWPRIRAWIDQDRTTLLAWRKLSEDAREWEQHGRDSSYLYRGSRLAAARETFRDREDQITPNQAAFLDASEKWSRRRFWQR